MKTDDTLPDVPFRMQVLVVDDNDDNRQMLKFMLERRGWDVLEACNGLEAVQLAVRENPALILMDIRMPVMDGLEATRRMKAIAAIQDIPIVAISADGCDTVIHDRAMTSGCKDCLGKPLDWEKLNAVLALISSAVAH